MQIIDDGQQAHHVYLKNNEFCTLGTGEIDFNQRIQKHSSYI